MAIGYSSEKGNQWWVLIFRVVHTSFSAISCNNLCAIGIDDFMDIGNNILDRKRRKKERAC
jgi:hypothetical protein